MICSRTLGSYEMVALARAASSAATTSDPPGSSTAAIEPVCRWAVCSETGVAGRSHTRSNS